MLFRSRIQVNQTIIALYDKFLKEGHRASSKDIGHFWALSRIFTGKPSDVERLLPDFDARVKAELERLSEQHAASTEIRELTEWMLDQTDVQGDNPQVKYAFMAVQRHILPLIGCLSGGDAAHLAERFENAYPRQERFPSHVELIQKLKEQSCRINKESL